MDKATQSVKGNEAQQSHDQQSNGYGVNHDELPSSIPGLFLT
jgi:hypothetical protein